MKLQTVYVTVGTTKFTALIDEITSDEVLRILQSRGCLQLILQLGYEGAEVDAQSILEKYQIEVEQYQFKFESTRSDITKADLVIGHAGAGTCMDILKQRKPGLIVVNETLMDNHQIELAQQLAAEEQIYYCNVQQLAEKLKTLDFSALKTFDQAAVNMNKFVESLTELLTS